MIKFLMVDVETVTSSVPRSDFIEADLDLLADMILESGGILKPLVVKKTGFEKYEVVDGHFEYYAAVRAREKNSSEGEMVNALIISPESEKAVVKQAAALKAGKTPLPPPPNNEISSRLKDLESRQTKIESRLEDKIDEFKTEQMQTIQNIKSQVSEIKSQVQVQKQLQPLEVFNTLGLVELIFRLKSAGFTEQAAAKIAENVEIERKKQKFNSLSDVLTRIKVKSGKRQVKGISSDKMVAIIDSWSRLFFS